MSLMKTLINKIDGTESDVTELISYPILPDNFVKTILDEADKTPEKSRAGTYTTHVHVSSLAYNFCPRQYAIAHKDKLSLYESLTGGHKVTFALGRAAETHVRDGFLEKYGRQNVFAKWECQCKRSYREGFYKEILCECGKKLDIFAEPDLIDDDNGVKGHPDLIFNYKQTLFVKEIKSMNKKDWDDLEAPLPAHILQAGMYPRILRARGLKVSPVVVFIYITKDFKWGSPYKEFHIDMSDPKYIKLHDDMLKEAKQVKDFVETGKAPERICPSIESTLAKKCPVAMRCFYSYDDNLE